MKKNLGIRREAEYRGSFSAAPARPADAGSYQPARPPGTQPFGRAWRY